MKKAIIYTRFSPRPDSSTCQSISVQRELCEQYCQQREYEVVEVFEDPDSSGGDGNREMLWRAVAATKRGHVLVVYDLDRLARRLHTQMAVEQELNQAGAKLEIVTGTPGGGDPLSTFIRHILAAVAEFDRQIKAARTSIHMVKMQKNGKSVGGVPPYGKARHGKLLVDEEEEMAVLQRIKNLHENGASYNEIAKSLNSDNVPARHGKWYATSVRRVCLRE